MEKIKVKIKIDCDYCIPGLPFKFNFPVYKTPGSAGCDLFNAGKPQVIKPMERAFIYTGISIQLPEGYEAQVRGRSGLNKNHGIVVPVGTIDSDYRGEIGVVVYNLSDRVYTIDSGDRIAQLVISPVVQADFHEVAFLDSTERGDGGFGSTGK